MPWQWFCTFFFVVLLAECEYLMDLIVQYHGWVAALLNRSCVYNLMVMVPIMFVSLLLRVQPHVHSPVMAVNGWNRGGFIIDGWVAALLNRSCVYNLMVMVPIMFVSLLLRVQPHVHSPFFHRIWS
eukprot:283006_1